MAIVKYNSFIYELLSIDGDNINCKYIQSPLKKCIKLFSDAKIIENIEDKHFHHLYFIEDEIEMRKKVIDNIKMNVKKRKSKKKESEYINPMMIELMNTDVDKYKEVLIKYGIKC